MNTNVIQQIRLGNYIQALRDQDPKTLAALEILISDSDPNDELILVHRNVDGLVERLELIIVKNPAHLPVIIQELRSAQDVQVAFLVNQLLNLDEEEVFLLKLT